MIKINNYSLPLITFISGASVMIIELVGTRILAPYFGTTIDILTSIISVVLVALSIGYWLGGKIADKKPTYKNLVLILLFASLITIFLFSFTNEILTYLTETGINNKTAIFIASTIFFGPVNILLGMTSPFVIRLKMDQVNKSGSVSGTFYAIGTVGSIFGTILTGFFLIPLMGVNKIVYLVGLSLFITSISIHNKQINNKIILIFISLFILLSIIFFRTNLKNNFLVDVDSQYQHISVVDKKISIGKEIFTNRFLIVNKKYYESGMTLEKQSELLFHYTKYFTLGNFFLSKAKKFLIIGGGGYSFPKYLLSNYPDATIDVIEIDPKMTEIAKKYFYLKDNPRIHTYAEDGRIFLNRNTKKYDVIIIDAFNDYSVPYSLTTKEALKRVKDSLTIDGLVITNIISAIEGPKSRFFKSEYLTYNSLFPKMYLFHVQKKDKNEIQGIILISFKNDNQKILNPLNDELKSLIENRFIINDKSEGLILTDNYAPVENMFIK